MCGIPVRRMYSTTPIYADNKYLQVQNHCMSCIIGDTQWFCTHDDLLVAHGDSDMDNGEIDVDNGVVLQDRENIGRQSHDTGLG